MFLDQKTGIVQKKNANFEVGLPTPSFSGAGWDNKSKKGGNQGGSKKMKFDDETVMKALRNNDE